METSFVPRGFVAPPPISTANFRLALLGPEFHESDYLAWTTSMEFIHSLPGWATSSWPMAMTPEQNLKDCESHLRRSHAGQDFAYSVLRPDRDEVIGCVYFTPDPLHRPGVVDVRSWVTKEHRQLDEPVAAAVMAWLAESWPWTEVHYAAR